MTKNWTDADDKLAARLWNQGQSYGQIGRVLGRTRCAVGGRLHRMTAAGSELITRPMKSKNAPALTKTWSDSDLLDLMAIADDPAKRWHWSEIAEHFNAPQVECKRQYNLIKAAENG